MATYYGTANNRTPELLTGSAGDDFFYPLGGWDVVQGGEGIDTVFVYAQSAGFVVLTEEGITYVDALSGASAGSERAQLFDVERIEFLDEVIDLTLPQHFVARDGIDIFVGNAGIDTVTYAGPRERYRVELVGDQHFVSDLVGAGGVDRLRHVERLVFDDGKLALDLGASARDTARLVGVLLGPQVVLGPGAAPALVGQVLGLFDQGYSLSQLAQLAVGALGWNRDELLAQVLQNIWARPATSEELAAVSSAVQSLQPAEIVTLACDLGLIDARIDLVGLAESGLVYF